MSTPSTIPLHPPRLLLRVMRTDADRRLILLILAILSTSSYIFFAEFAVLFLPQLSFSHCANQSLSAPTTLYVEGLNSSCSWQINILMLLWLLLGLLLVLGLAFLIYWFFPIWKCKKEGLQPLTEPAFANVIKCIEDLRKTKQIRVTRLASMRLNYVHNPLSIEGTPQVFGSLGRYFLSLPGEWIQQFANEQKTLQINDGSPESPSEGTDLAVTAGLPHLPSNLSHDSHNVQSSVFQSVILHELSHFHNKDVERYYFAKSILYAFVIVTLLPFLLLLAASVFLFSSGYVPNTIFATSSFFLGVIFPLVQVRAIYCAILRSREIFADIQAVQWGNSPEMMEQALDLLALEKKPIWPRIPLFHTHPPLKERKENIKDQSRVFRLKPLEALGIGIVFGIALPPIYNPFSLISQLLTTWLLGANYPSGLPDLSLLLLCLLLVFIIGQMVWRAKIAMSVQNHELYGTGLFGLCLAAGLALGFLISLSSISFFIYYQSDWEVILFYLVPWIMFLVLGLYGFCKWLALLASYWLEVVSTERGFHLVSRVSFVVAGLILAVALGVFSLLLEATVGYLLPGNLNAVILTHVIVFRPLADINFYWRYMISGFLDEFILIPYIFLLLASLWALPLLSWFWYRKTIARSRFQWAPVNSLDGPAPTVPQNPFHLRSVILIALIGSFIFCLLLLPIRLMSTTGFVVVGPFLLSSLVSLFLTALFQAGLAALIAIRTRMINGLFSAFLCGCVVAIGTIGINSLFGGIGPDGPRFIFVNEVSWGTVCTLVTLTLIGVWRSLLTRRLLITIPCILLVGAVTLFPISVAVADYQYQPVTNIVKDGDFEQPMVLLDPSAEYSTGQSFGSWTVASGNAFLIGTTWIPAHGAQSVDLYSPTAGSIYQNLSTTSGANYSLSFAMAGSISCPASTVIWMQVLWGSNTTETLPFNVTNPNWNYLGWQYYTYKNLQASDTVTRLSFKSLTSSVCDPALDDITVRRCASTGCPSLPSPSSTATSTGSQNPTATHTGSPNPTAPHTGSPNPTATHGGSPNPTATSTPLPTATSAAAPTPTPVVIPNPYASSMSNLIMDDPLVDNSRGYAWDETAIGNASCGFSGGAYHIKATTPGGIICTPEAPNHFLSNLTYQISLKVTQGELAGLAFRFNQNNSTGYVFFIDTLQGTYTLGAVNGSNIPTRTILTRPSAAINKGLNQSNVLAIVANGNAISLYINGQFMAQAIDGAYSQGQMGIFAQDNVDPVDVLASNARAWTV